MNMRKAFQFRLNPTKKQARALQQFQQFLSYKAEEAGRKLGLVNSAYTTQTCYQCKNSEVTKLSEREHRCSKWEYKVIRDLNAALNILAFGLDGLGAISRSPPLKWRD